VATTRSADIPYLGDAPAVSHGGDTLVRFRCPECGVLATVYQRVRREVCRTCRKTVLNRWNRSGVCGACEVEERERFARERWRGAAS
jgi:hypothetical protein